MHNYIIDHQKYLIGSSEVFYYKIDSGNLDNNHITLLSDVAKKKAQQYISGIHKNQHIVRHLLLREILSDYGKVFYYDHHGKLCLEESDIGFSLSYSDDNFITAISKEKMVGADIEEIKSLNYNQEMMHLFLTEDEIKLVDQSVPNELFYLFWTAKEAFIKAIGLGMKFDLKNIEFALDQNNKLFVKSVNYNTLSETQILLNQRIINNLAISIVEIR